MNAEKLVRIGNMRKNEFEYEEAYAYYLEAAIGECDPDAIENLGELYLYGSGVRTDYKKAFHYFRLYFDLTGKTNMFWPISEIRDEAVSDPVWKEQYAELIDYTIHNKAWEMYIVLALEYSCGEVYPKSIKKKIDCYKKARKHFEEIVYSRYMMKECDLYYEYAVKELNEMKL